MKRALVIGGSRFVGPHLVDLLLKNGYRVGVFNRGSRPDRFVDTDVVQIVGDRNDESDLIRAASFKADIVFDTCCYEPRHAKAVVRAFGDTLSRYVYLSTAAVYQDPREGPIHESMPLGAWPLWGDYGRNKAGTDQVFLNAFRDTGFPISILRPTYILGEENHVERERFFVGRLLRQAPIVLPGDGLGKVSFAFADEVAETLLILAVTPQAVGNAYNFACDQGTTLEGFVHLCANFLGVEASVIFASTEEFKIPMEPFEPLSISPFSNTSFLVSNRKLKKEVGADLRPFENSLEKTIRWYAARLEECPIVLRSIEAEVLKRYGHHNLG